MVAMLAVDPPKRGAKAALAAHCKVSGQGIEFAATGVTTDFVIEAGNAEGPISKGGDAFFVYIRGTDRVRARVTDRGDGSYLVAWKAHTSGFYKITVSLFGEQLPGSPFEVYAYHTEPFAPACQVKIPKSMMKHIVSREPVHFDVTFRDKLGDLTTAGELDVYVESSNGPQRRCRRPSIDLASRRVSFSIGFGPINKERLPSSPMKVELDELAPKLVPKPDRYATQSERALGTLVTLPWELGAGGAADKWGGTPQQLRRGDFPVDEVHSQAVMLEEKESESSDEPTGASAKKADVDAAADASFKSTSTSPDSIRSDLSTHRVTGRANLDVHVRQRHMELWTRRMMLDKHASKYPGLAPKTSGAGGTITFGSRQNEKSAYIHELAADPTGFAYGGVYPGFVHAHGELHEKHRVSISIGKAGYYKLHVRLRKAGLPLPGSPFDIRVEPGAACAVNSNLTSPPRILGRTMRVAVTLVGVDVMGNACSRGGAKVAVLYNDGTPIEPRIDDQDDGTYELEWKHPPNASPGVTILLNGAPILGSPFRLEEAGAALKKARKKGHGAPVLNTRRRMSVGLSGLSMPTALLDKVMGRAASPILDLPNKELGGSPTASEPSEGSL